MNVAPKKNIIKLPKNKNKKWYNKNHWKADSSKL